MVVLVAEAAAPGLQGDASSVTDGILLVATILFWNVAFDDLLSQLRAAWDRGSGRGRARLYRANG